MGEKEHLCTADGNVIDTAIMENSVAVSLKIKLLYNFTVLLLGIYLKRMKTPTGKDFCALMFAATLFTTAKIWKQPVYK